MAPHLTLIEIGKIIGYSDAGWSNRKIGSKLKRNHNTISAVLKKQKETGKVIRKSGSGRPKKLSPQTARALGRAVNADRFITATALQTQFRLNEGENHVSTRTIRRTITDIRGYNSYWAVKKPYISERNRQKRLLWCQDKIYWTAEQWRKVLWTDESPFCLRYSGRLRVWRLHNERYSPQCLQGTVKHDKKIMVWGAFAAHGVGHLHRIEGTMDRHIYRQILIRHMKLSLQSLFPQNDGIF